MKPGFFGKAVQKLRARPAVCNSLAPPAGGFPCLSSLVAALLVIFGILPRIQARTALRQETLRMAVPTVAVVQPKRSAPAQEIVLPANVQAFSDAPIYARTNGYLKRWYVDIGTRVKSGQLLAEIDTPEVNQQLRQARADLATSQANLSLSKITADRYAGLLKTDSVSKQESDNAAGDYEAKQAALQSAQANVKRLEELQSFEKIYAPFDGVITARNTDVGALINSGSAGGNRSELFHIAQPDKLRVYVSVPQAYSQAAKPGLTADLTLAEFPGRRFEGKLVRTANAIDPTSRTLLVEIAVNNPTGQLFTGSYAEVHLKLPDASVLADSARQHAVVPRRRAAGRHGGPGSARATEADHPRPRFWQRSRSGRRLERK